MKVFVQWHGEGTKAEINRRIKNGMRRVGQHLVNRIKKKISGGRRDLMTVLPAGEPPHVDTGRLRNSIFFDVDDVGGALTTTVGTTLLYGLYLETGGTVRPKTKQWLTIPASEKARSYSRSGATVKDFPIKLTFILISDQTALLIDASATSGDKIDPDSIHYVLKKSVDRPPHPFLRPTLEEAVDDGSIEKLFAEETHGE